MIAMDIYELSNVGTQEAFWWWLLFPLVGIFAAFWSSDKIGLAVLGMGGAGKTTFYNYLRDKPVSGVYEQTTRIEYNKFSIELQDGKKITIKKGQDISGEEDFVQPYYESMMKDADIVLFFFDAYEYLHKEQNKNYDRETNARIDFIYEKKRDGLYIILTHADKFYDKRKKALEDIRNKIKNQPYYDFFLNPQK
ncbi:hypothetical protein EZS27_023035 [termite gut metagenome]|uniref:Uncharacterized protein n=1 Tax=termite gut metagenome TaxID=433724 RepID=A0A5J4R2T9_9ZZZZ